MHETVASHAANLANSWAAYLIPATLVSFMLIFIVLMWLDKTTRK